MHVPSFQRLLPPATRLGAVSLVALWTMLPGTAADPDALWQVVHDRCVPHEAQTGDPAPCKSIDTKTRTAVLKDRRGATQFLLIPTDRISGIESPVLLAPGAPNYMAAAWAARRYVETAAGKAIPREDIGLAINSVFGRSQRQLHIHIDCVAPAVKRALHDHDGAIGAKWADFPAELEGHRYRAMRVEAADLAGADPFRLLADGDPAARADMARETLAVIGARFADGHDGFVLLSDRADPDSGDRGAAESLLDHDCAVLK